MLDVVIIGGGAVAEALAHEIDASEGLRLIQQWRRKTDTLQSLAPADLYILAVSDSAVAEAVTGSIAGAAVTSEGSTTGATQRGPTGVAGLVFPPESVVAHTAGSVSIDALSPHIAHRAVLYPLQTFTRGRRIEDFRRRVPFFIEGTTPRALETVRTVAEAIADNVTELPSEKRERLHLAAVFANNFANAMFCAAEQIAAEAGVPYALLTPLIAETAAKAQDLPSPRDAQTGPAKRGDRETQQKHLEILQATHPELTETYKNISEIIWKTLRKN
jgi:predicted short-subunit dehydrogenase-like oxidoreductase (DUF2520 family)